MEDGVGVKLEEKKKKVKEEIN